MEGKAPRVCIHERKLREETGEDVSLGETQMSCLQAASEKFVPSQAEDKKQMDSFLASDGEGFLKEERAAK